MLADVGRQVCGHLGAGRGVAPSGGDVAEALQPDLHAAVAQPGLVLYVGNRVVVHLKVE